MVRDIQARARVQVRIGRLASGHVEMARDAGLSRESLYRALSDDRAPAFDTVLKVVTALGLQLHAGTAQT